MNLKGFIHIIVGLIFLFLNFYINGFDIIPDFVGYIFILVGLNSLSKYHPAFSQASVAAAILLVLSIIGIFQGPATPSSSQAWNALLTLLWFVQNLIALICAVGLRLLLGKGMVDLLKKFDLAEDAEKTKNCVTLNIVLLLIVGLLSFPPLLSLQAFAPLTVLVIIAGLFAGLWLMIRINQNRELLESKSRLL